MHEVLIDGIRYTAGDRPPSIGVGITTRNRNKTLATALEHWRKFTPADVPIIVVDDASEKPVDGADFRFDRQAGIAVAKNKTIELLELAGVEHLFLADDDCYPAAPEWWRPYVESPEPHLMYIFEDVKGPTKLRDIRKLHDDGQHVAWTGPRGCLLYAHRSVLPVVGGMDPIYGHWGYDHGDWSNRIHHAGLTSWRYADVADSGRLWHSMDEWGEADRVVPQRERDRLVQTNVKIHHQRRDDWYRAFVPYVSDDVVLTCLFTGGRSPESGRGYRADPKLIAELAGSIQHGRLVCFHDQLADDVQMTTGNGRPVEFIRRPEPQNNVFFWRHLIAWQWLRDHPGVRRAWTVDGTDVTQLRDPFTGMQHGKLYVGYEPKTVNDPWMIDHHTDPPVAAFLAGNGDLTLLNAGVLGGDRRTLMSLLHQLSAYAYDVSLTTGRVADCGDMGALQKIAYERFADRLVTGPKVTSIFKHFEKSNEVSLWRHK